MGFSRQEYWSGLSFPSLGDLPRDRIQVFRIAGRFFTIWATREALLDPRALLYGLTNEAASGFFLGCLSCRELSCLLRGHKEKSEWFGWSPIFCFWVIPFHGRKAQWKVHHLDIQSKEGGQSMKEAIVPLFFQTRAPLWFGSNHPHGAQHTVNKPISTGCHYYGCCWTWISTGDLVRAQSSVFQLEMPLHSFPRCPITQTQWLICMLAHLALKTGPSPEGVDLHLIKLLSDQI